MSIGKPVRGWPSIERHSSLFLEMMLLKFPEIQEIKAIASILPSLSDLSSFDVNEVLRVTQTKPIFPLLDNTHFPKA